MQGCRRSLLSQQLAGRRGSSRPRWRCQCGCYHLPCQPTVPRGTEIACIFTNSIRTATLFYSMLTSLLKVLPFASPLSWLSLLGTVPAGQGWGSEGGRGGHKAPLGSCAWRSCGDRMSQPCSPGPQPTNPKCCSRAPIRNASLRRCGSPYWIRPKVSKTKITNIK